MTETLNFRGALMEVGLAIRRPEALTLKWVDESDKNIRTLIVTFLLNAVFGVAVYGLSMKMHAGLDAMLWAAFLTPLAAGGAWTIAMPALYILNSATGSKITLTSTILLASVTVCFGSWAMLASVPINWFFTLALPYDSIRLAVNLIVFFGVGACMRDVFVRVLKAVEPERSSFFGYLWLTLLSIIGIELFYLFGIFHF